MTFAEAKGLPRLFLARLWQMGEREGGGGLVRSLSHGKEVGAT